LEVNAKQCVKYGWIGNLGWRIVWYHFQQSTVNAFKCLVLTLLEEDVHHQVDVIINQDLGVLVSIQAPLDSTPHILNLKNGEKMKHPIEYV